MPEKFIKYKNSILTILIDEENLYLFDKYRWYPHLISGKFYIQRTIYLDKIKSKKSKRRTIFLHREIMQPTNSKEFIDHKNGNTLDNRKMNLRLTNARGNNRNSVKKSTNTSGYKGVQKDKRSPTGTWGIQIKLENKVYSKWGFETAKDAAKAYNKIAFEYFGEFAKLNDIED